MRTIAAVLALFTLLAACGGGAGTAGGSVSTAIAEATSSPEASTNVWTVEVVPGNLFAYALRREDTDRRFRVEFDLSQPVPAPPAPWGVGR